MAFWFSTYYTAGEKMMPVKVPTYSGTEEMTVPARKSWPSGVGLMSVAWVAAVVAFYTVTGSIHKDKRLILCGYRPWQILGARLILLIGVVLSVSVIPLILLVPTIAPLHPELVWLSSLLVGLIAVTIGLFVGAFILRPTEGILIIIALFGISMSVSGDAERFLLTYPAMELLRTGLFAGNPLVFPFVLHTLLILFVLGALTIGIWSYRVKIHRW